MSFMNWGCCVNCVVFKLRVKHFVSHLGTRTCHVSQWQQRAVLFSGYIGAFHYSWGSSGMPAQVAMVTRNIWRYFFNISAAHDWDFAIFCFFSFWYQVQEIDAFRDVKFVVKMLKGESETELMSLSKAKTEGWENAMAFIGNQPGGYKVSCVSSRICIYNLDLLCLAACLGLLVSYAAKRGSRDSNGGCWIIDIGMHLPNWSSIHIILNIYKQKMLL